MAILNKTGITTGGTIQAEHVTRTIDALTGVSTDTIIATGSFTGSFLGPLTGTASFATTASFALNASGTGFPYTGSARITGSLIVTGSITNRTGNVTFAGTNHQISGSSSVSLFGGTVQVAANPGLSPAVLDINVNLGDVSTITGVPNSAIDFSENGNSGTGFFRLPLVQPSEPKAGYMYWDDATSKLFIYSVTLNAWVTSSFG